MELESLLKVALRGGATEILLKSGQTPRFRFNNEVVPLAEGRPISDEVFQNWVEKILPTFLIKKLETQGDAHFSYESRLGVRFRILIFRQRQAFSMILRVISPKIPAMNDLLMPPSIQNLTTTNHGLVVIAGPARSGKSTLIASMLSTITSTRPCHITTIEDPIEFNLSDQKGMIEQREVGVDTPSFEKGLRASLQHRPDVLAISELRDKESLELCLQAAQGGTLVLMPMTAMSVADAVERLLHQWHSTLADTTSHYLASCLRAVVSLTPVRRADGKGFIAATELLVNSTKLQAWLIGKAQGESGWGFIKTLLTENIDRPHTNLDESLTELLRQGVITKEEALGKCENREEFTQLLRRAG